MTVKELIEQLEKYPPDMPVAVTADGDTGPYPLTGTAMWPRLLVSGKRALVIDVEEAKDAEFRRVRPIQGWA